jgi:hypothetical protein
MPWGITQTLICAMFISESDFEHKMKEGHLNDHLT